MNTRTRIDATALAMPMLATLTGPAPLSSLTTRSEAPDEPHD